MKIKNILYVVSLLTFAGINAAAADPVPSVVQEGQAVAVNITRTTQSVLLELAGIHPAAEFIHRNFFVRAGGNLRVAGVYAYHVLKYPVVLSASYLPVSWVLDGHFIKTVFTGAVGALTVAGFYKGICDADKALENEKKVEEYPVLQNRLNEAAGRIAGLENMNGTLTQVQSSLAVLQAGCKTAVTQLTELQTAAQRTQQELSLANTQLNDVVRAQQEVKVTALIQALQRAMKDTTATWEKFDAIKRDKLAGDDVQERLQVAAGTFQGMQICEEALIQINGFGEGIDPRYQAILHDLQGLLQPVLKQQRDLKLKIENINTALSLGYQGAERLRLDGKKQLALEAAVTVVPVVPVQQQRVQNIQPHIMVLQNNFGFGATGLARSLPFQLVRQPRPATPPSETAVQVTEVD